MGPNPTDRAKNGVKRSLLVERDGGPLAITVAGANVPDAKLLARTIEAIVLERPEPEPDYPQHLCPDKGYDNEDGWGACVDSAYVPHMALIWDERPPPAAPGSQVGRGGGDLLAVALPRGILIHWEKKAQN